MGEARVVLALSPKLSQHGTQSPPAASDDIKLGLFCVGASVVVHPEPCRQRMLPRAIRRWKTQEKCSYCCGTSPAQLQLINYSLAHIRMHIDCFTVTAQHIYIPILLPVATHRHKHTPTTSDWRQLPKKVAGYWGDKLMMEMNSCLTRLGWDLKKWRWEEDRLSKKRISIKIMWTLNSGPAHIDIEHIIPCLRKWQWHVGGRPKSNKSAFLFLTSDAASAYRVGFHTC